MKRAFLVIVILGIVGIARADDDGEHEGGTVGPTGPQGIQGVQGVAGQAGKAGMNGKDGSNGLDATMPTFDAFMGVDTVLYDGKYIAFTTYYDRSLLYNENVIGGRLSVKIGKNYEEKEIETLRNELKDAQLLLQKGK